MNRHDKQSLFAKKLTRMLCNNVLTKFGGCIIMDDKTLIKCDSKQLQGQKLYYATMRGNVPSRLKYNLEDKKA